MARGIPDPERDARILALHKQGLTRETIAERLGMAASGVGTVLKRMGVRSKSGPRPKWSSEKLEIAKQKWIEGLSASEIGVLLGVSKNAVVGVIARMGVQRPAAVVEASRRKGGPRKPDGTAKKAKGPKKAPAPRLGKIASLIQPMPFHANGKGSVAPTPPKQIGPSPNANPKPFAECLQTECLWPISGEGADMICCGAPKGRRDGWCSHHAKGGRQRWDGKGYHAEPERYVADLVRRCA